MIWLASYPRSGNTFVRNILYEVYGVESSVFHCIAEKPLPPDYFRYEVVKTHELPENLDPRLSSRPAVYILRDGRDAIVSEAWHRKHFYEPRSRLHFNMLEAILADGESHFGGWAGNVSRWIQRADIILRFEDLVRDPLGEVEKLRSILRLPPPRIDRMPDFEKQKSGRPKYGRVQDSGRNAEFFRKGKSAGWKEEMPKHIERIFWRYHGEVMESCGYRRDGFLSPLPDPAQLRKHLAREGQRYPQRRIRENLLLLKSKYLG